MPFWRRRHDETTPEREVDEPVDPDFVDPSWEPDPADFEDGADTTDAPTAPDEPEPTAERVDPLLPFDPPPPTVMTIEMPTPSLQRPSADAGMGGAGPPPEPPIAAALRQPSPRSREPVDTAAALDAGLERTRGGFMSRLRGALGDRPGPRARPGTTSRRR